MHNDQQGLELRDPQLTKDHTQTQTQIGVEGIAVRIKLKNLGEGCQRSGSERREHRPVPPGYWRWHVWKRGLVATREALPVAWHAPTDSPRGSGRAAQGGGEARSTGEAG